MAIVAESTEIARAPQFVNGRIEGVGRYFIYPNGLNDLDHPEADLFAVEIRYHGTLRHPEGGWSVSRNASDLFRPSIHEDPQWGHCRADYLSQYRFDTFEEALTAARIVVDGVEANGRTWMQWQEYQGQSETPDGTR